MYAAGYNKLFWGMIFLLINIKVGIIDLLPNIIGYLFFYSGLSILSKQHIIIKNGQIVSLVLAFLSLMDLIMPMNNNLLVQIWGSDIKAMLISTIAMSLNLYLINICCRGIYFISEKLDNKGLKEDAKTSWISYFIICSILIFFYPFSINFHREMSTFITIIIIMNVIISIGVAGMFRRARMELGIDGGINSINNIFEGDKK